MLQRCVRASDGIFYSNSIQNGSYGMLKVEYSRNIPGNIDGSFGICKGEYGHSPTGILLTGQGGVLVRVAHPYFRFQPPQLSFRTFGELTHKFRKSFS